MGGPPKVIPYTRPQIINVTAGQNVSIDSLEIISGTLPHVQWFHLSNSNDRSQLPYIPQDINWMDINNPQNEFVSEYIGADKYESFKIKDLLHTKEKNEFVYDKCSYFQTPSSCPSGGSSISSIFVLSWRIICWIYCCQQKNIIKI